MISRLTEQTEELESGEYFIMDPRKFKSEFFDLVLEPVSHHFLKIFQVKEEYKESLEDILYLRSGEGVHQPITMEMMRKMRAGIHINTYIGASKMKEFKDMEVLK